MKFFTGLLLLFFHLSLVAQDAPTLYGKITVVASSEPLEGATLILINTKDQISTISDENGNYFFENLGPGRYELQVDYLGYQSQKLVEILIESGRSMEIDIQMVATTLDLPIATVRAGVKDLQSNLLPSVQILTIEETRRLPATFNDPARQVMAYPGVVNTNDQANNISVRGNSPAAMSLRLEGVEIVNPNHLSNAGTRSDQVTIASGGVNMLSAQMLSTSAFYAGAAPVQFGNLQGGLMDMRLRSGNREKWEGTFQVGLLGLDASFEGPFTKNKNSSYLINYRYSTLGLLNGLGVELGDESIKFQDLSIHLNFPTKKLGTFRVFGISGSSATILEAERDTSIWKFTRDRSDINYNSNMQLAGLSHKLRLGKKAVWNTTYVYSRSNNERNEYLLNNDFERNPVKFVDTNTSKNSLVSKVNTSINSQLHFQLGIEWLLQTSEYFESNIGANPIPKQDRVQLNNLRPFIGIDYIPSAKLSFHAGIALPTELNFGGSNFAPRLAANYQINDQQKIKLSAHRSFRRHAFNFYLDPAINSVSNKTLRPVTTDLFSLEHSFDFKNNTRIKTAAYFQSNNGGITESNENSLNSSFNSEEIFFPIPGKRTNGSLGRNYGIELLFQKYIQEDFYFIVNGTIFKSEYKNFENSWRPTRYDAGYVSNATVGKELRWQKNKKDKTFNKTLGINVRLTYLGNLWYTPVDLTNSIEQGSEVLIEGVYSEKLKPYAKGDIRIYLRTDKRKYSNSLSLDVQNFFNRKNDGYFFYDQATETVLEKKQLGLIPILNWRLSF